MNRANALPQTGRSIPANVALYTSGKGQSRLNPCRQTQQKVGLPGRRSCGLSSFALCCAWASTVKWLK